MELLARYLTAIKFWLPKAQRDDIAAELAVNLQAEIDDRAAGLGRPLSDEELAAFLKAHGSPLLVASRFQLEKRTVTFGRQLIGPVVFPFYWIALKVTLVLLLLPAIVPALVWRGNFHPARELAQILYRILQLALPTLFFVTAAFVVFDFCLHRFRLVEKWSGGWDPRALPPPDQQARQVRRSSSIAGIVLQSIFIVWWLGHDVPRSLGGEAGAQILFAPVWQTLHFPILLLAFVCLTQHWINLVEPDWYWLPPITEFLTTLAGLIVLYPLLTLSPLLRITDANGLPIEALKAARIEHLLWLGLFSLWLGMLVVGAVYGCRLVWLAWRAMPRAALHSRPNGVPLI